MTDKTNLRPQEIYQRIISDNKIRPDAYICIIAGRPGPTGKSWLTSQLNVMGYTAIEISEPLLVSGSLTFNDNKNHFLIDNFRKTVVVILNEILDSYKERFVRI